MHSWRHHLACNPDVCISGAGIIGLSIALELHQLGVRVTVLDRAEPLAEASFAAAGMLAAQDPENHPALRPLSDFSLSLYPKFLARIQNLSGIDVPFQTKSTLQALPDQIRTPHLTHSQLADLLPQLNMCLERFVLLQENSLDPHQLASALLAAVRATTIDLKPFTPVLGLREYAATVAVETPQDSLRCAMFINCSGAWASTFTAMRDLPITPIKGQMLRVALPPSLPLYLTLRTPRIYVVPRIVGPAAGQAVIGATVEHAGYDKSVIQAEISALHRAAAQLLPQLGSAAIVHSWAGLRPSAPDGLPVIGRHPRAAHQLLATGHLRNGILLAPATAHLIAQLFLGKQPSLDISAFSPTRTLSIAHGFR